MMTMMMMMQEDKRCKDGKRTHQAVNQGHIDMLIDIARYPLLRPLYTPYIWMLKLKKNKQTKCKTLLLESSLKLHDLESVSNLSISLIIMQIKTTLYWNLHLQL